MPPTPPVTKKDTVYINYFDGIDMDRARMLMGVCTTVLGRFQPKTLYFMFATPGGQVDAGIALYNFLKGIPPKIVMHNMSAVNSIGNVVFLAGDERYASPNSTFLFHGVETQLRKDSAFTLHKIREIESNLREDQNKIAGIIVSQTKITDPEIRELFDKGESKSADFALAKGFISEIKAISLKPDDVLLNVGFQAQR